jgi:hypothetical protein
MSIRDVAIALIGGGITGTFLTFFTIAALEVSERNKAERANNLPQPSPAVHPTVLVEQSV